MTQSDAQIYPRSFRNRIYQSIVQFFQQMVNARTQKFFSYYKPYMGMFIADMVCAFMVSAITLILPLCARYLTQNVLVESSPDAQTQIYMMGGVMLVLIAIYTACNTYVDFQGHVMGTLMESDMRRELFAHYQTLSFRFYDDHKTGQLMSRITHDLFWLSEFYHHGPEDIAIALLKMLGVFAISLAINVELTLMIFITMPFMAVYAYYFNRRMRVAMRKSKERIGDINAQVEDALAGVRVVKSFTNEVIERDKFEVKNERFVESRRDGYRSEAYFYSGMMAYTQFLTVAVIILGGIAIVNGTLDLTDLVTYLLYVGVLVEPIQRLINFARLYQDGITGFHRFMDILEVQPDIKDSPNAIDLTHVEGRVTFDNVSFRYNDAAGDVLKNISLEIQAGEYIALVGPSGVGKTTLCSLIPRFYEVNQGAILLDGINIQDIQMHALRAHIGIVHQDIYLFAGTVADNIQYGRLDASREDLIEAAKKANAHEFIMALPDGYDTDIGQRGVKLSGGQKQCLSIARVFLKNPPVIIFDEATSALDNESEKAIKQSLEALANNRTTIVIAHRLSTVRNAQRILVLSEEGIVEQGTHEALIAQGGAYANLYTMQLTM